jgi:outer membrane protein assembly factor BamE (lipoprotein component of BamABCDE complex)
MALAGVVIGVRLSSANKFPAMTTKLSFLAFSSVLLLATAGCSTVDSRIAKNRPAFDTWPASVQDKVIHGQIDVGFTVDEVRVALGEPDRVATRTTGDGTSQVWSYRDRRPRIGIGLGFASFGRSSATGVGVSTSSGYRGERLRVNFDRNGRVSSIEQAR